MILIAFPPAWSTAFNTDAAANDLLGLPFSVLPPSPFCESLGYEAGSAAACANNCFLWPNIPGRPPAATNSQGGSLYPSCVAFVFVDRPPANGYRVSVGCCFSSTRCRPRACARSGGSTFSVRSRSRHCNDLPFNIPRSHDLAAGLETLSAFRA